jgi:hypothetical protein
MSAGFTAWIDGPPRPGDPGRNGQCPVESIMLREYWRFYWPLALTGGVMVLSGQFQNGVLARYPEAVTELAVYAIASSTFGLLHAAVGFVSQMANVFARSVTGTAKTLRFVMAVSAVITVLMLMLAFTPAGAMLVGAVYDIDSAILERVTDYLKLFAPLMVIDGLRQFQLGLLVQCRMTGRVTILNIIQLTTIIVCLVSAFSAGVSAPLALVGSQIMASLVHLMLLTIVIKRDYQLPRTPEHENLRYRELLAFFAPVATTGIMFAISRPVLYALIARTPDAIVSIAAMRVGFDVATLFQVTANQFRHFFVTFGDSDLREKRLFMVIIGAGITGAMLLISMTPLSDVILADWIGIKGEVLVKAHVVLMLMCLLPGLILWRNYYHGLLMVARKTNGMAVGGMSRVLGIYVMAQLLYLVDALDYLTGTIILLLGFLVEASIVTVFCRSIRRTNFRSDVVS